ncbi:MAG: UvrD-helicase domain-containing protein [Candidatus Sumerlaeota bacterium]|nr:UvrD-helicase domain-containing protein [Candidatus Sumerlaeota bacterium]
MDFLSQLNPTQREAAGCVEGPLLIIAGAGSGKTRVITHRIAHLLAHCGAQPWNIFAVTFTNKAAEEMRRRVVELLGEDPGTSLQISTFHSACARLLRRESYKLGLAPGFSICDDSDQVALLKDCLNTLEIEHDTLHPRAVQNIITQSKMRLLGADDYAQAAETKRDKLAAEVFALYQKRLRESNAVDFDDLIGLVVQLFEESPETLAEYQRRYRYVLVDEYQDTNYAQYRLVEALAREHRNLCVVGDEDQSIYSWRGAEISNLLDFQKHFPEARVLRLEQNYRSTQAILEVANASIRFNQERLGKTLFTAREGGAKPMLMTAENANDETRMIVERALWHHAHGIRLRDMAIFYRANSLSRPFEDELRRNNVPYRVIGGVRFYDRAEIKDLLAYLHLIENPDNALAFMRVINRPRRGLGEKSVADLQRLADHYHLSCFKAIARGTEERKITGATAKKLGEFHAMVEAWRKQRAAGASPSDMLASIRKDTQYEEKIGDPKDFEVVSRKENIDEFATAIKEFESTNRTAELGDFLEMVSLRSAVDEMGEKIVQDSILLMTLHCAKGLEFKVVFVAAVEEPIFPNHRALNNKGDFEEERRLFYVGVTRAEDHLYLSRAESRFRFGANQFNKVSRFLTEIPAELLADYDRYEELNYAYGDESGNGKPSGFGGNFGKDSWQSRNRLSFDRNPQLAVPGLQSSIRGSNPETGNPKLGTRNPELGTRNPELGTRPVRSSVFDLPKSASAPHSAYIKGERVSHPILGEGTVEDILKTSGHKTMIMIRFDGGETMAMAEKQANLKKV